MKVGQTFAYNPPHYTATLYVHALTANALKLLRKDPASACLWAFLQELKRLDKIAYAILLTEYLFPLRPLP